ncbi:MAG TPA: SGNH/GDSL hydrolase family protein [Alphaproteobacteria bacterium]|nr:SGNH/GDSL hydrolase family protein [Alphaproteobacteria bacterium]
MKKHKNPLDIPSDLPGKAASGRLEQAVKGGFFANIALMISSLLFVLAFCELLLFRFIFIPSDVPANIFTEGLVRLRPGDEGVWRVGDDVAGQFRINAQGWNSGHASYEKQTPAGVKRIAIIGDSFAEALQVPYDASLAESLEKAGQGRVQVYRFGISGAPLSHYLAMARHVARTYHPDMIVLLLVHNDFDESFLQVAGRYTSSFLKFRMDGDQVTGEIPPAPWQATWRDRLRQTATLRYLYYRQKLGPEALLSLLPSKGGPAAPVYQANVALDGLAARRGAITGATDYAFAQFLALSREYNFRPLLLMDGDRRSIEAGLDSAALYRDGALWLNAMASGAAARTGIAFIDMHPLFEADWRQNHQPLSFVSDNHWNARAHQLAARALEQYMIR